MKINILSGPNDEIDLIRADTALEFGRDLNYDAPIRIIGAGKDLARAMGWNIHFKEGRISKDEYLSELSKLDHHLKLYNYIENKIGKVPEVVRKSKTLVENVFYGFTDEEGIHAIITEPWHYKKFDYAQKFLKFQGKIPKDLEFFNVASQDTGYYTSIQKLASNMKTIYGLMKI